jgi:hypothetical protein
LPIFDPRGAIVHQARDPQATSRLVERRTQQAEVPLTRAMDAGHQCVYTDLREYLAVARSRVEAPLANLANR